MKKKFEALTVDLLAHKYRYYKLNAATITDYEYDMLERKWKKLGGALGIDMDEYPHWVDFDEKHPLAALAKASVK